MTIEDMHVTTDLHRTTETLALLFTEKRILGFGQK